MYVADVAFFPFQKYVTYLKYKITPRDLYFPQDNVYSKQINYFLTNDKIKYKRKSNLL